MKNKPKIFYGWVIVGCGILILSLTSGMILNTFSLFMVPICDDMGFTRAQVSFMQTMFAVANLLFSLFSGFIFSKLRMDRLMRLGAVMVGLFYFLLSLARSLWVCYLLCFLIATSSSMLTWMPFSIIISNWFHRRGGLALGLTFMGSGLGGTVFMNVIGALLPLVGWRVCIRILSGVGLLFLVPLVFFVLKASPHEMGLSPYGEAEGYPQRPEATGPGFSAVFRTPRFLAIAISLAAMGFVDNALSVCLAPYLLDEGFSVSMSALVASLFMAVLMAGKVGMGAIADRIGIAKTLLLTEVTMLAGLVCICRAEMLPFALLTAVLMGFFESAGTIAFSIITHSVYGTRDFGVICGIFTASCSIGSAVSPTVLGLVNDAVGSYKPAFVALIGVTAVFMTLLVISVGGKRVPRA